MFPHASVTKSVTLTWGGIWHSCPPDFRWSQHRLGGDAPGIHLAEAKGASKRPTKHRLAYTTKDCLVQKVNSAKAENPGLKENYEWAHHSLKGPLEQVSNAHAINFTYALQRQMKKCLLW